MKIATYKTYRIYGAEGHRQRESFNKSYSFRTYNGDYISVNNWDKTGTNDYTELEIFTNESHYSILWGQLNDGVFENSRWGKVVEVEKGIEVLEILK